MSSSTFVIVGAGLAGAKAAAALRDEGFDGRIVLVGDESEVPYERPPLSKGYLLGSEGREKMRVAPPAWYPEHDVELIEGVAATKVDREERTVTLADGRVLGYDALLLATGATPRRLPVPGADLGRVHYLRRVEDCDRLKEAFATAKRLVCVGGGWIGLEVAAAARKAGLEVHVVEGDPLPLGRVLGPEIAEVFAGLHREHGVELHTGAQVTEITGQDGNATGVVLADGGRIEADLVVVGIGAVPNTQLAADSGLAVEDGILVDAALRTSDRNVYAAGDVANAFHPALGRHIRVEHWDNARKQGQAAAQAMLGQEVSYDRLPYFYTDQYDLGMEFTGYLEPGGYEQVVVRGDAKARKFIVFYLNAGRVQAAMNVNIWDVNKTLQHLVASGAVVDPAALADPDTPLEQLGAA